MKDITFLLQTYRECTRHLWNSGFLTVNTSENEWDMHDEYANIATQIFTALVIRLIGYDNVVLPKEYEAHSSPLLNLYVVPFGSEASIFINRSTPPSSYWDETVKSVMVGEAEIKFIRYFDFDEVGMRDFEYYLTGITRFDKHPHLVGRNALMRVNETRVLYKDE